MTDIVCKKRKIDFENIDLDKINEDFNLNLYKNFLKTEEYKLKEKLNLTRELIKKTNFLLAKKCENENNGHEWIREREDCMYGSKFTYCKLCKTDYYDRTYFHQYL